ncbi:MAG: hypothetical protein HQ523_10630 [Lentisphaerae bacterium]|nr:hypothetical protein [Lentisphaerota bacterium]
MTAWDEWKERCAVALCSPEARTTLQTFGGMRFRTLAQRCLPLINVTELSAVTLSDGDAWHLLERHMTLPDAINGKAYKQWLFARLEGSADPPFDIIQGGATLLMRWVVREHLRSEYLPSNHLSLDHPPASSPAATPPLSELLPGTVDARCVVEQRELERLAAEEAAKQFTDLPRRARLALVARHLDIPLTDPRLLAHAECRRSAMHEAYRRAATQTIDRLRADHPNDDPATVTDLALLTFEVLTHLCFAWAVEDDSYHDLISDRPRANALEKAPA